VPPCNGNPDQPANTQCDRCGGKAKTTCLRPDRQTFLPVDKVIVEPIKNSPAALRPTLSKMAFILLVNMNGKTGMIGPMARVWIAALFRAVGTLVPRFQISLYVQSGFVVIR